MVAPLTIHTMGDQPRCHYAARFCERVWFDVASPALSVCPSTRSFSAERAPRHLVGIELFVFATVDNTLGKTADQREIPAVFCIPAFVLRKNGSRQSHYNNH